MEVRTLTTQEAAPDELAEIRGLMDRTFGDEFTDADWEHSVGGHHVVAIDNHRIEAHAALVPRSIEVGDRTFQTGYVEAVGVEPGRQNLGVGTAVMRVIAEAIAAHYELGALSTGEHHFYERLGWERWRGPTYVRDGEDHFRTGHEDDGIMVLRIGPSTSIDLTEAITCMARTGDDW